MIFVKFCQCDYHEPERTWQKQRKKTMGVNPHLKNHELMKPQFSSPLGRHTCDQPQTTAGEKMDPGWTLNIWKGQQRSVLQTCVRLVFSFCFNQDRSQWSAAFQLIISHFHCYKIHLTFAFKSLQQRHWVSSSNSRSQSLFGHVGVGDLVHQNEGSERRAQRRQVPGVFPHHRREPAGAEAQQQADAAQQVRHQSGSSVVAFQLGQGPAFSQRMVDERHGCQRLQTSHTHGEQAEQAVPGGEVGFAAQVLVVGDGCQTQRCARHAQALQRQVNSNLRLVREGLDGGAVRREDEDGFGHEEGKLVGGLKKERKYTWAGVFYPVLCFAWLNTDTDFSLANNILHCWIENYFEFKKLKNNDY